MRILDWALANNNLKELLHRGRHSVSQRIISVISVISVQFFFFVLDIQNS
ncbi:MAG: hypothetical protein WCR42_13560 [bacterium]